MFARLLLMITLLALAPLVQADCPMQKKQITGQVELAGEPLEGAVIEARWDEQRMNDVSARARSDADGAFVLSLTIDTFDGRTLTAKEKCGYMPKRIELTVRHDTARAFNRSYKFDALGKPLAIKLRSN
jgi:hypothetical protein